MRALRPHSDRSSLALRYTLDDPNLQTAIGHGEGADSVKKFLLAERLVQAGVRCVSLSLSDYDTHSNNFPRMRQALPVLDHGLATLIDDLDEGGMLGDVSIAGVGRVRAHAPMINAKAGGRDHWPRVFARRCWRAESCAGQVIGSTDRLAEAARRLASGACAGGLRDAVPQPRHRHGDHLPDRPHEPTATHHRLRRADS